MRIALDATPLIVPTGGIRRYVEELVRALTVQFPHDSFQLISDQPNPPRGISKYWWMLGANREMRRREIDLFHGTDFSVPYVPLRPSVLTLHDLSPWRFQDSPRVRQRTPYLLGFGIATAVITPSRAIRKEAITEFRLSPARVTAVPLAAPSWMTRVETTRSGNPYFLYVGTIGPRKNIETVITAWRAIRTERKVDLVLAGRLGAEQPPIQVEPGLRLLGPVADRELPRLYSGAAAVVYPSLYEGFGLPVLEAMQCGVMVIISTDPALVETGGDAAVAVAAKDVRGWIDAMRAALTNETFVATRQELSLRQAARFNWTRTAKETYEVYLAAQRQFTEF